MNRGATSTKGDSPVRKKDADSEIKMIDENLRQRFGDIAIRKQFITKDQFVEAMAFQIENELEGIQPKLIGSILRDMGYITAAQIDEVVSIMAKADVPVCPNCGILTLVCSNCGATIR